MSLANADKHRCKRLDKRAKMDKRWTREQRKEKSVIDYVMSNKEYLNSIKVMIADEAKEYTTYKLDQQNQDLKKKYSDHNVIILKTTFHAEAIQTKKRKILTTKGYEKYKDNIE